MMGTLSGSGKYSPAIGFRCRRAREGARWQTRFGARIVSFVEARIYCRIRELETGGADGTRLFYMNTVGEELALKSERSKW